MDLRIFTEPQRGANYPDLLRVARCAEDAGFDGFFHSDHYLRVGDDRVKSAESRKMELERTGIEDGWPGPTDAWTTLAGLARETSQVRLGALVTVSTFRLPGPLASTVAQVNQMSGGRIEFGMGPGWCAAEHTTYGIPLPPLSERFDRLTEQLEIITGLWSTPVDSTFDYEGNYYRLTECPAPPTSAAKIPVLLGGAGEHRIPELAARFAAEFNVPFPVDVHTAAAQFDRAAAACRLLGRDPEELIRSVTLVVCMGRDDVEVARRAAAIDREPDEVRRIGLAGSPAEVVDQIGSWQAYTAVSRLYLQVRDLSDLDHIELIAEELLRVV